MTVGLDPEWIAEHSAIDGRRPRRAEFAGFVGTGQMSRNARFALMWDDGEGPETVIVKLPSSEVNTRTLSFDHGAYLRECTFYRTIAPLVDICMPQVLAVHYDAAAYDFAVVLEDLAGSEQGDQFTEPSDEQLVLAIEQCAALHAPLWNATDTSTFDLYREDADDRERKYADTIPGLLDAVHERLGAGLDPAVPELIERFARSAGRWARLTTASTTLVHGDFRPDNFMFAVDPGAPAIAVVDWQTVRLGIGVTDVAYLLGAAIRPEKRREIEHDMLQRYRSELERRGVTDYPQAQCERDYALGSLHGVVVAIRATTVADRTERGDAMLTLMLNRHARHALDVGALDLIESS
ncbi:MAG: phosphotransferase [Acidimicrobiales bacterium]